MYLLLVHLVVVIMDNKMDMWYTYMMDYDGDIGKCKYLSMAVGHLTTLWFGSTKQTWQNRSILVIDDATNNC